MFGVVVVFLYLMPERMELGKVLSKLLWLKDEEGIRKKQLMCIRLTIIWIFLLRNLVVYHKNFMVVIQRGFDLGG